MIDPDNSQDGFPATDSNVLSRAREDAAEYRARFLEQQYRRSLVTRFLEDDAAIARLHRIHMAAERFPEVDEVVLAAARNMKTAPSWQQNIRGFAQGATDFIAGAAESVWTWQRHERGLALAATLLVAVAATALIIEIIPGTDTDTEGHLLGGRQASDPVTSLSEIRRIYRAGDTVRARAEMVAFCAENPRYPIPDDLLPLGACK